jgi:hypothetical protein
MYQTSCRESENAHFLFSNFFKKSYHFLDNVETFGRAGQATQMTIWHTCIACWIPKATNTYSEYVILTAFPLQQWLHKTRLAVKLCLHFLSCLFLPLLHTFFHQLFLFFPISPQSPESDIEFICVYKRHVVC